MVNWNGGIIVAYFSKTQRECSLLANIWRKMGEIGWMIFCVHIHLFNGYTWVCLHMMGSSIRIYRTTLICVHINVCVDINCPHPHPNSNNFWTVLYLHFQNFQLQIYLPHHCWTWLVPSLGWMKTNLGLTILLNSGWFWLVRLAYRKD